MTIENVPNLNDYFRTGVQDALNAFSPSEVDHEYKYRLDDLDAAMGRYTGPRDEFIESRISEDSDFSEQGVDTVAAGNAWFDGWYQTARRMLADYRERFPLVGDDE